MSTLKTISLYTGMLLMSAAIGLSVTGCQLSSGKKAKTDATNELGLADSLETANSTLYLPPVIATPLAWSEEKSFDDEAYQRLTQNIPRLDYSRSGRWPVLVWAHSAKAGDELQAWIDRGVSPFYNYKIAQNIAVWKQMQEQDVPVIFMLQGHVQRLFRYNKRRPVAVNNDHHLEPAKGKCPAYFIEHPHLKNEGAQYRKLYKKLNDSDIKVDGVFIDFESGAYLRNGVDKEVRVRQAMAEALKCPRCLKRFGKEQLSSIKAFRALVDESRAEAIKTTCTDPLFDVYPKAKVGNFFAWPIDRYIDKNGVLNPDAYEITGGSYPAYGYKNSGMNIAQPRCYFVHGWQGWGMPETVTEQNIVDWNVFTYCIERFSLAANVIKPGEKLVPWVGWLWGHSFKNSSEKNLKAASADGYKETIIHTLLRGAETIAIFAPSKLTDDFKPDYTVDRKELGPFLRNLVDVQAGYNEVLRFQPFLNNAKPLNLHHDGVANEPGIEWSGYGNEQASLVRTVSFRGDTVKSIRLYGYTIKLPFRKQGAWFWVFPDGSAKEVKQVQ
jgi:hypothetical protein